VIITGGLGILELNRFASVLRLRWLWHEWVFPEKTWVGTEVPYNDQDRMLFAACTTITLGNCHKTLFWSSSWLQGRRPRGIAPLLFEKTRKKKRTVAEVLRDDAWIWDLNYRSGCKFYNCTPFTIYRSLELRS
jgi:hypothetical protein